MLKFDEDSFLSNYKTHYSGKSNLYPKINKGDSIYSAFYRVVTNQKFLDLIIFYNDQFQVPPVVTFLQIEYLFLTGVLSDKKFFNICKGEQDNKILGTFFGCLFYDEFGYQRPVQRTEVTHSIDLPPITSATYFVK